MVTRYSNFARTVRAVFAVAVIAAAWHVTASGKSGLTITFPDRIVAGPDFATDVLKDAWDFSNAEDVGLDPGETANWSNFSVAGGVAGGTAATDDATLSLLFSGFYTTNNPGKIGINLPIDSSRYQKLSFRMSSTVAGNDPQIYYFHTSWLDPADGGDFDRNQGVVVTSKTINGTKTFVQDMTQTLGGHAWTSGGGIVRGLRLDPNNSPTTTATGAGQTFLYDWVRLTYADNAPGASMENIQWSGGSGATTIDVYDGTNTTLILNVATTSAGATSYLWNSGVLPPGSYTLRLSRTGADGTKAFTINTPPSVTVTDPSRTTGRDYATTVQANPWDMSGPEDIVIIGAENITPVPPDFNAAGHAGELTATNTTGDPNIMLLHDNNNGHGTKLIDTTKYHYLTYRMQIDGPFDLANGSIARVVWGSSQFLNAGNATTTQDTLVWPGMNSYTLDLATLTAAPNGGLESGGAAELWTANPKTYLRFDPHEFGTNPGDPTPTRTFHIDDVKLTATPVAFGNYTIHFAASDADGGDTVIVNLYRDTDLNPNNGKTLIAAGLTAASGSYLWDTVGNSVPQGTYYIYAEATDTYQLSGSYSDAPLVVSAPCSFSLAPTSASVPNSGGSSTFALTTGSACEWTAASNASFITVTSSPLGTGNGTISYTVAANPARTVRTGTLTAGGQTFTVTQLPARGPFDFDGDGRADRTVYSPGSGTWSTQNGTTRQYGLPGDIPVPGDYNGDGVLDTAVYRPSSGDWFIQGQPSFNWGRAGDIPVPADYNGDGVTDAAVFRTTDSNNGVFFVRNQFVVAWGLRGDIPLASDFDGDGKADLVVFRPATGQWFLSFSSFSYTTAAIYSWGVAGDIPVTGDFDGDGRADLAAYRPSIGGWFLAFSSGSPVFSTNAFYQWGIPGDLPLALDMDGDRKDELVVFRRSDATWWTRNLVTGGADGAQFGASGDLAALERPQFHPRPTADFDGDQRADITVFRPSTGEWYTKFSATDYLTAGVQQWGLNGDVKVPGDYDGDGKTDLAVYRPSDQIWYVKFSSTGFGTTLAVQWGIPGDVPVPADYDGDGTTDQAVYRPSSGEWYRRLSGDYVPFQVDQFGLSTDVPVPADYDGDGRADLAVFRPSTGQWYLKLSSGAFGGIIVKQFALAGDVPMPSDWDGDGRAEIAVFRPSTGEWFASDALISLQYFRVWGAAGDLPVTQDFDGDGVMDSAVYHPSTGQWFVKLSSSSTGIISTQWGLSTDQPLYRIGG